MTNYLVLGILVCLVGQGVASPGPGHVRVAGGKTQHVVSCAHTSNANTGEQGDKLEIKFKIRLSCLGMPAVENKLRKKHENENRCWLAVKGIEP